MPATRKSSEGTQITPAQRRDEVVAIIAAGLVRLVRLVRRDRPSAAMTAEVSPDTRSEHVREAGEKLSESAETGLELSRETRLSVPTG